MSNDVNRLTDRLAEWAVSVRYEDLPVSTVHAVKRSVVDSVGCMARGSQHETVDVLLETVRSALGVDNGSGEHRLVGRSQRLDIVNATLANGVMAHVLDFDDTILPTRCHVSAPLLPALLAACERTKPTPSAHDVIAAFAVGFELVTRCADAVYAGPPGWHGTGVMAPLGTAAAVGRLLGLDAEKTAQAMALSANQASGLRASFGSMAKSWNLGRAGANGMYAALLAAHGFTGGWDILDVDAGFLELYADPPEYEVLVDRLGQRWAVERNGFKPYPSGFVTHAALDAVLQARAERLVPADEVEAIRVEVCPQTLVLTGKKEPATGLEGKFSIYHAVAAAYLDGAVTPETFTDDVVRDEHYRTLAARVEAHVNEEFRQDEAAVEIVAGGSGEPSYVAHALGAEANPMDDSRLDRSFVALGGWPRCDQGFFGPVLSCSGYVSSSGIGVSS
ncbi:MAG: MmgE/PrpD family protein, partial [Propionibacteriales bacterium]|nr:MmgE/PrpD family protein [Propionibacteriales bacterium]